MADNKMNKQDETNKQSNEQMQREQGQSGEIRHDNVGGNRQPEQGGRRGDQEKSAIGGGQSRNERGQSDKSRSETDKNRSEPTGR